MPLPLHHHRSGCNLQALNLDLQTMSLNQFKYSLLLQLVLVLGNEFGHSMEQHNSAEGTEHLQLAPDSPFKITLFADLHFGENAWSNWAPQQDLKSLKVMSDVLDSETPDLVVYLGDVITANNIPLANASMYWNLATSPTRERGIAWASIFGNHDDAQFVWPIEWFSTSGIPPLNCSLLSSPSKACDFIRTTRMELMNHEIKSYELSMSQIGPMNLRPSISNYVIRISSSDNATSPVVFLYFLDSGGGSYPKVISSGQVEWFQNKSQEINPDSRVLEIIFWHIPSKAYSEIAPSSNILKPCVGSINYEKVATQEVEFGIMDVLDKRPSVKAVIVGHNHGLDWCCPYKKLWLCFARHSGYGGYGSWGKGARILEILEKPFSLKSWIRMEDGSVHSQIDLCS